MRSPSGENIPRLELPGGRESLFETHRSRIEDLLPAFLRRQRWFAGKSQTIQELTVLDAIPLGSGFPPHRILLVSLRYASREREIYNIPVSWEEGELCDTTQREHPDGVIAQIHFGGTEFRGILFDALLDESFHRHLFDAIFHRLHFKGFRGEITAWQGDAFRRLAVSGIIDGEISLLRGEQSNASILFGNTLILKLFRRLEAGIHPDLELGRFLSERTTFGNSPIVAGALEYATGEDRITLGILQGYIPHSGSAWSHFRKLLHGYLEKAQTLSPGEMDGLIFPPRTLRGAAALPFDAQALERIGPGFAAAHLLGRRTAELHAALASQPEDPDFSAESFTPLYRRSLYDSMRRLTDRSLYSLRENMASLPDFTQENARQILERKGDILALFRRIMDPAVTGKRIRTHGDFHLGQVLFTERDFVIIDFEGEPGRSLAERRVKHSPLRDVAGMLRSFHYLSMSEWREIDPAAEDRLRYERLARYWQEWVSIAYLQGYLESTAGADFISRNDERVGLLLPIFLLEKAVYELHYELGSRPDWIEIPMQAILQMLDTMGE